MTAIQEKGVGSQSPLCVACYVPMPGFGSLRAGCSNVKIVAAIHSWYSGGGRYPQKNIVMLDQYILIVKQPRQTSSELEVMHKKA